MPQTGGARGGKPQSRLSGQTKKAISSSGLSKTKKQALRAELRSPGVSKRESRLVSKATSGNTAGGLMSVFAQQATRSKRRAAGKLNSTGGPGGKKRG